MTARLPRSPICSIVRESDNGLPEKVTDGAFALSRTFNDHGEVDGLGVEVAGAVYSYDLTRDDGGRIETRTETVAGAGSLFKYGYDPLGRLLTVTRDGNLVEEYRYDNNGNRTYQMNAQLGITGRTFTHSLEDHTLTAGSITYEFDADDNLAARLEGGVTTKYAYSTAGELLQVTLPDATVISYVHDPLGRRIAKKVNGTTVEKYLWSGRTTLLAVYDGNDNLRQRFQYADDRMPFAMTMGSATYYLAYDQVGSLRLVVDSGGSIVKRIEYDSFGNILSDSNPSITIPFGFAGGLHDRDTGLVRFGYRDYLPEIGKWTAKDPIDFAGGDSNLYGYVANDPVNWVDPEGLDGIFVHYDGYSVNTGLGFNLPLGHAGAVAVDPKTGTTRYYEYGRYESDFGQIKRRSIPDLKIGPDKKPTPESLKKLYEYLSKVIGKGFPVSAEYYSDADYQKIVNFVAVMMNNPKRDPYNWSPLAKQNHCKTFAREAINAGR